jgi:hypothetical protein
MIIDPTFTAVLPILLRDLSYSHWRDEAIAEVKRMAVLADRYLEAIDTITINAVDGQVAWSR